MGGPRIQCSFSMMYHVNAILIGLLVYLHTIEIGANINGCHSILLRDCNCGRVYRDERTYFVVNCTNTGFHDTSMLEELPEETEWLVFTGNHIPILDSNVFGEDVVLKNLEVIDMTNNGIRDVRGKAFHRVMNVKRLILNHNNITISENDDENFHHPRVFSNFYNLEELHLTNAFADNTDSSLAEDLHDIFVNSNLTKLYKLHLEQNEIKNFKDDSVFCDLPNLHDIYLGNNNIPNVNFNINCMKRLRYIDLEQNNITKFTQKDLDAFDRAAQRHEDGLTLDLDGNPFRCDVATKNFYGWLLKTKVVIRNKRSLQCQQSRSGRRFIMNLTNFAEAKHARVSRALTILLVVLTVVLLSLVAAFAYLRKETMSKKLSPIFDSITRKVHYTHIESQDV